MAWTQAQLATPLNFGLIENHKSYWASHFYSVLQCLHSHRTLQYAPSGLAYYPNWKLRDLRADLPPYFFSNMESYMRNWGFQYFMSVFLNYKMSADIVAQMIGRLAELYNTNFLINPTTYRFFISGSDSILSEGLLNEFTDVFPTHINGSRPDAKLLSQQSDLCLVLDFPIPYARMAIFGEVEGVHGIDLSNASYWKKKLPFCVFTVGVINGAGKHVYIADSFHNEIPRVNLIFERKHPIVQDFQKVLTFLGILFWEGKGTKVIAGDEEFDYFFKKIKTYWECDTLELINDLATYCTDGELIGVVPKGIGFVPNIQA